MTPKLETVYQDHLAFAYTSVDRIYLRGFIPIMQSCGGFRCWAERLRPEDPVTQTWIRSLARRFHTNVKRFAQERGIPILEPKRGQRKHLLADEYREKFAEPEGVYLIIRVAEKTKTFTSQEPRRSTQSKHRNLDCRQAFVDHYSFYILDRHWGPICVVLSSHAPFNAKVFLNGHHWAERRAAARSIVVESRTNAFLGTSAPERLQRICDGLCERDIRRVADRWVYRLLPVFTKKERWESGMKYEWSMAQMEVSHNLVFREGYPVAEMFHRHIDLNRRLFSPNSISTVFGRKKSGRPRTSTSVYQSYDSMTVFRIKHDKTVIKQYDKHHRILRTECVVNDPRHLRVRKLLSNFGTLRAAMAAALGRFQALQHGVADSTLNRGELAALAQTSELGSARVPGIRLDNERMMKVISFLGRLATEPRGFTAGQLRERYQAVTGLPYSASQATYDLRKLRAKQIIEPVERSRRYVFSPHGGQLAVVLHKIHDLLIAPLLPTPQEDAGSLRPPKRGPVPEPPPQQLRPLLRKHAGRLSSVARELGRSLSTVRRWIQRERIDLARFNNPIEPPSLERVYQAVHDTLQLVPTALGLRL